MKNMKRWAHRSLVACLLGAGISTLLVAGCSGPRVATQWRIPAGEGGSLHSVLVVVASGESEIRRDLEDQIVASLREKGWMAAPSFHLVTNREQLTSRDFLEGQAKAQADAVLLVRLAPLDAPVIPSNADRDTFYDGAYSEALPDGPLPQVQWDARLFAIVDGSLHASISGTAGDPRSGVSVVRAIGRTSAAGFGSPSR